MGCVRPKSYEEAAEVVKAAERVVVVGNGRHLISEPEGDCLSFAGLNEVLQISQEDLFVTVQAGVEVKALQSRLEREGLFLPVHYDGTVGGLLGLNRPSPYSFWYGLPSDFVLGAKILTGLGEIVRSGANTPKFSSGYKLYKALAGSLGLFGAYLEVNLRVYPLPEEVVSGRVANPEKALESPLRPYGGVVINDGEIRAYITMGGWKEKVERAVNELGMQGTFNGVPEVPECGREALIQVPRGLEVEYLKSLGRGYAFLGSGSVFLCDPDVESLRKRGMRAVVVKGCKKGEDCFGFKSAALKALSKALDPRGVFQYIRPTPW